MASASLTGRSWPLGSAPVRVLFRKVWPNPQPQKKLATLDFISGKKASAPALLGVTAE